MKPREKPSRFFLARIRAHFKAADHGMRSCERRMRKMAREYAKYTAPARPGQIIVIAEGHRHAGRHKVLRVEPFGFGRSELGWSLKCQTLTKAGNLNRVCLPIYICSGEHFYICSKQDLASGQSIETLLKTGRAIFHGSSE
jgi:hypothetical protein